MKSTLWIVVAVAALAVACNKSEEKKPEATMHPATPTSSEADESDPPAEKDTPVVTAGEPDTEVPEGESPVMEHFEEEASNKVTEANLEVELDALEAEIGN